MKQELILDLTGMPDFPGSMFKVGGGGYNAYLRGSRFGFMYDMLSSMSIYGGSTKHVQVENGNTYFVFELSCDDLRFLSSTTFDKMCFRNDCTCIIRECGHGLKIIDESIIELGDYR